MHTDTDTSADLVWLSWKPFTGPYTELFLSPSSAAARKKMPLPSGCGVCGKDDRVLRCSGCRVMLYCSVEHQTAHRRKHKSACSAIRRCRITMENEERVLRDHPDNIFTYGIGHFWKIHETRPYMRYRAALSDTMTAVNHVESLQKQLNILIDNLYLSRGDNMGSRDVIPSLMIRLQQDQECYDFLKWWATTGQQDDYDWGNNTLPYLDVRNANPLEPVDIFCGRWIDLPHLVAVTLVKVKVLQVLQGLLEDMGRPDGMTHMPELGFCPSTISNNPNIITCDKRVEIGRLKAQIRALYNDVHKLNAHFWPALMNPGKHLDAKPMRFSVGSVEQMQMALNFTYEAWDEAPGAIAIIKKCSEGKL
ncbi:hypothetical protein DTO013E5_3627 [Penicillium roqueforti]|nr:hypothetical protein DTO012A1_3746 [Penicillium roqueforti]KAI2752490.1 hypothetical protein DTO013F2_3293 [Penicillium roqueforti]KAI3113096.1 hypothetical protein CBS147333_3088 [Penicillium roqueforti]KAI3153898.1 hypothetical protein CBS147325_990 [Penicillium roqueforti]KAI3175820.1 hypothetical protein DTO046C5_2503 [Penicillium roqueforti]